MSSSKIDPGSDEREEQQLKDNYGKFGQSVNKEAGVDIYPTAGSGTGSTSATGKTTATGKTIYKTTGKKVNNIDNHVQHIGCGGHSNVASRRGDCKVDFTDQEATVIVQFTSTCRCGDELTIKHWGPKHDDGECCWEIGCVNQSGEVGRMGEGPHPNTTSPKPTKVFGNIGNVKGAKIGVKSIVWKTSGGGHHEMWVDKTATGNNWNKVAEWEFTSWGGKGSDGMQGDKDGKNTDNIASNLTVEFRCDCDGAQFSDLSVDEIVPSVMA
jgi:hypothetical protein